MAEPAVGLEERMTRLESEMVEVRYLATKAERDGADFRAVISGQTGLLNALRETQMEHGQTLARHDRRFDSLEDKVDSLEDKVDRVEDKVDTGFAETAIGFATVKAAQEQITRLLNTLVKSEDKE